MKSYWLLHLVLNQEKEGTGGSSCLQHKKQQQQKNNQNIKEDRKDCGSLESMVGEIPLDRKMNSRQGCSEEKIGLQEDRQFSREKSAGKFMQCKVTAFWADCISYLRGQNQQSQNSHQLYL